VQNYFTLLIDHI